LAAEDKIKEIHEIILESFAKGPAENRMVAFAQCFSTDVMNQVKSGATAGEAMTVTLGCLLHNCARHPEWLMAVVRDSHWLKDCMGSDQEYEKFCSLYITAYPLPEGTDDSRG